MDMLKNLGTTEWIALGAILLFFLGGKKIPELARGVGDAIREFKKAARE